MARKTICPSRLSLLVLGLAALPAAGAGAQRPETHTVRKGDTLWDLARQYLGDPFLWPQIYRLNTAVVEDPHWIYPGEVLRLVATGAEQAVPAEPTPSPTPAAEPVPAPPPPEAGAFEEYPMPAFAQRRFQASSDILAEFGERIYRPLRAGEFYSSGFLTEGRRLPFGQMLGPVTPQQIRIFTERSPANPYAIVGVRPPSGATYAEGDSLLVVQLGEEFPGWGASVTPTGLVRIAGQSESQYLAEVVALFGPLRNGQLVLPAERFGRGPERRAVPVGDGLTAEVIGGRELRELKHPQNVLFISAGRGEGVAPGDVFEVRRRPGQRTDGPDTVDELMATGQIVRVGERSATLLLFHVVSPDIPPGTPVRQVAKLPVGSDR